MLLVRPYTNDICAHWRFVDETTARNSSAKIYQMFLEFKVNGTSLVWTWREILGDGFYKETSYANHSSGRKYDKVSGKVRPQEKDWRTNEKSSCCRI